MKVLWVIIGMFSLLFCDTSVYKGIVYADTDPKSVQDHLLKLQVIFIENPKLRVLRERHDLQLEVQQMGEHSMVVVWPLVSLEAKHSLLMELTPIFPDIFIIEDQKNNEENRMYQDQKDVYIVNTKIQWLIVSVFFLVALVLFYYRRKNLRNLHQKQKKLHKEQQEMENKISKLEMHDA